MKQKSCIYPCLKFTKNGEEACSKGCLERATDSIKYSSKKGVVYLTQYKDQFRTKQLELLHLSNEKTLIIGDLYGNGEMARKIIEEAPFMKCKKIILYEFEMDKKIQPALSYFANKVNFEQSKVEIRPIFNTIAYFAKRYDPEKDGKFDLLWLDYCKELTEDNGYEKESSEKDLYLFKKLMKEKSALAITGRLPSKSRGSFQHNNRFIDEKIKKYYPTASLLYEPMRYVSSKNTYSVYIYELLPLLEPNLIP